MDVQRERTFRGMRKPPDLRLSRLLRHQQNLSVELLKTVWLVWRQKLRLLRLQAAFPDGLSLLKAWQGWRLLARVQQLAALREHSAALSGDALQAAEDHLQVLEQRRTEQRLFAEKLDAKLSKAQAQLLRLTVWQCWSSCTQKERSARLCLQRRTCLQPVMPIGYVLHGGLLRLETNGKSTLEDPNGAS
ncbi:unnamed protein product, partial [Effrenium voratum]